MKHKRYDAPRSMPMAFRVLPDPTELYFVCVPGLRRGRKKGGVRESGVLLRKVVAKGGWDERALEELDKA